MPGASFVLGEVKVRPGAYARWENAGARSLPSIRDGVGAILLRSDYGPINEVVELRSLEDVANNFGEGGTIEAAYQFFQGGGLAAKVIRLGSSSVKATVTLEDTTGSPIDVVRIDAAHGGTGGNAWSFTVRDSLSSPTLLREGILYDGSKELLKVKFDKGVADEPQALVDAIVAAGTTWITATYLAAGTGLLAAVLNAPLASGTDPVVIGADYTTALALLSPATVDWNFLVIDTTDATIQASVQAYLNQALLRGHHAIAFLGIGPDVAWATRITRTKGYNSFLIVSVLNGGVDGNGVIIDGWKAAARAAGLQASVPYNRSITGKVVEGFSTLSETLDEDQIVEALESGGFVFTTNGRGQVQVEDDHTSLSTLSVDLDEGWMSLRRVRERFHAVDILSLIADSYKGQLDNDELGRTVVLTAMNQELGHMVAAGALFAGATAVMEPEPPPGSDYVFISIIADDKQSIKKFYLTFKFRANQTA